MNDNNYSEGFITWRSLIKAVEKHKRKGDEIAEIYCQKSYCSVPYTLWIRPKKGEASE